VRRMLKATWALPLPLLMGVGEAWADAREVSVRCAGRLRRTTEPAFGQTTPATSPGIGCALGYGLGPALTATLGYGFSRSGELRVEGDGLRTSYVFRRHRHDLGLGLGYAPSDELTPVFSLELGAAGVTTADPQRRLSTPDGERRVPPTPAESTEWSARAQLEVALEWRFLDQASVGLGPFADWADGRLGYGGGLWLALYRYR
jgi:hypothetical protein